MTIFIGDKPEMNVVNVGDEISSDQLAAIQQSSVPSSGNPFVTVSAGDTKYLVKNGGGTVIGTLIVDTNGTVGGDTATITGTKVEVSNFGVGTVKIDPVLGVTFPDGTSQGTAAANLVTSVAGKTGAVTLAVADVSGAAGTALANTFTANQLVNVNTASGVALNVVQNNTATTADCVRITNLGAGNSFVVEDSTSPDASPFVINQNGNVGIGTTLPTSTLQVVGTLLASSAGTSVSPFFRFEATNTGSTQDVLRITNGTLGNSFVVYDQASDTTPFIVDASGNVGVKNASPTTDLDVAGNGKFTTADITSAPAAGDSSTKVPTTAWVQAEVPAASTSTAGKVQLATTAESLAESNTAKSITPFTLHDRIHFGGTWATMIAVNWGTATSGTGAAASGAGIFSKQVTGPTTSTGYATIYLQGYALSGIGKSYNTSIDWSKRVTFSARILKATHVTDANSVIRLTVGKSNSVTTPADLSNRGIGIKIAGNGAVNIQCHDGTTLTNVATSFTPTTSQYFDFVLISDGLGTVTCYVNGASVGSTTGGPTTQAAGTFNMIMLETENLATITAPASNYTIGNAVFSIAP